MTPVATPPQTLQGAAAQVGKCGAAGTASNAALPTLRAAKVPATHFRIRMSTEPLSPREAGRRYLHRGTLGDVSSNGHRRPKFVVTEVRWCIPHANPHEYERPRYQQGRTSNLASGRGTTGPQAVGTEAQAYRRRHGRVLGRDETGHADSAASLRATSGVGGHQRHQPVECKRGFRRQSAVAFL